eukprot:12884060-Alexandrium_andersonii.AAC.1
MPGCFGRSLGGNTPGRKPRLCRTQRPSGRPSPKPRVRCNPAGPRLHGKQQAGALQDRTRRPESQGAQ